jgi:choline dehydrogenase-like flavoprotein
MRLASAAICRTTMSRVSYPVVGAQTRERALARPAARRRGHALALHRQGHADLQPVDCRGLGQSSGGIGDPDMQVTFAPGSFKGGQIGELEETPGLSAGAWQMRPLSRGYVEAKSNRPGEAPAINPRYLSEKADRRVIIGGLRMARWCFEPWRYGSSCGKIACPATRSRATTNCSTARKARHIKFSRPDIGASPPGIYWVAAAPTWGSLHSPLPLAASRDTAGGHRR